VGNVTEVRSPRYFDSNDTNGFNKAREQWTYNGRNLVATHVEAPGTTEAGTESYTDDLLGNKRHIPTLTVMFGERKGDGGSFV
jgi:hypothetical protein